MAYTIVKKAYSPEPFQSGSTTRIVIPSSDSRGVPVLNNKKYYVRSNNSINQPTYRYVDSDGYDGYRSESPVIVTQKSTPRANYTIVNHNSSPRKPNSNYVYYDEEEEEEEDNEVYYYIDGKYYKSAPGVQSAPQAQPVYVKPQKTQPNPIYYYPDSRDSEEEVYYEDVEEEVPVVQKKVVFAKKPAKPQTTKVMYVEDDRAPTVIESPRIYRVKSQSVIVRPNTIAVESMSKPPEPRMKPLHKIIMQNRSKPRRNHRKEIEKIEIRDKPLPNRNLIHGNTIVYK